MNSVQVRETLLTSHLSCTRQVIEAIKLAPRPLNLVFRSREMFFQKLNSTSTSSSDGSASWVVETAISPSEVLKVERVEVRARQMNSEPHIQIR